MALAGSPPGCQTVGPGGWIGNEVVPCRGPATFPPPKSRTLLGGLTAGDLVVTSKLIGANEIQEEWRCPISLCQISLRHPGGPRTSHLPSCTLSHWLSIPRIESGRASQGIVTGSFP